MDRPVVIGCLILALDSFLSCGIFLSHFHGTNHIWIIRIWMPLRLLQILWIKLFAICQGIDLFKAFRGCLVILAIVTQLFDLLALAIYVCLRIYDPEKYALIEDYLAFGIQWWFDLKGFAWLIAAIYKSFQTPPAKIEVDQDRSVYEQLL